MLSEDKKNMIYGLHRSSKYDTFDAMELKKRRNVTLVLGDVKAYHSLVEIITDNDIDQIYHLAAQPIVQKASRSPAGTYETNVFGTVNVLEAVRNNMRGRIPVLVMSSDKAYGPSIALPYTEEYPLGEKTDIYSSSKSCADIIARAYAYNYDMPVVVARPANTYGEFDLNFTRLIPTLAQAFYANIDLVLNKGSYHYLREYNYVGDTVHGLAALMHALIEKRNETSGQAFNISSGCVHSTEEVVKKFIELTGFDKQIEFREKESTFKEIEDQYLDTAKIRALTGWKPEYNLETGLKRTMEGYDRYFKGVACRQ